MANTRKNSTGNTKIFRRKYPNYNWILFSLKLAKHTMLCPNFFALGCTKSIYALPPSTNLSKIYYKSALFSALTFDFTYEINIFYVKNKRTFFSVKLKPYKQTLDYQPQDIRCTVVIKLFSNPPVVY